MIWDEPTGYQPTAVELDMRERWLPTERQIDLAVDLLSRQPARVDCVYVPLVQPGKSRGVWELGQEIRHVHAAYLDVAHAERAADTVLGDCDGTIAYAAVWRDRYAAVFEGFRGATR